MGGDLPEDDLERIFLDADVDNSGALDFEEFEAIMALDVLSILKKCSTTTKEANARSNVAPSDEPYFGAALVAHARANDFGDGRGKTSNYTLAESQTMSMRLYEGRCASLQRAVAFFVLFHEMGRRCMAFWPAVSCGLLRYRMDRTHSIMRIATTASPVSGAELRERMRHLALKKEWKSGVSVVIQLTEKWAFMKKVEETAARRGSPDYFEQQRRLPSLSHDSLGSHGDRPARTSVDRFEA